MKRKIGANDGMDAIAKSQIGLVAKKITLFFTQAESILYGLSFDNLNHDTSKLLIVISTPFNTFVKSLREL